MPITSDVESYGIYRIIKDERERERNRFSYIIKCFLISLISTADSTRAKI